MRERKYVANLAALGAFIRARRHDLDLTQSQLADRVGWVQERISLLEHGKYGTPSLPLMAGLAEALEVEQEVLLSAAGFLGSTAEQAPEIAVERRVRSVRTIPTGRREIMSRGELSQASVELASQVERLQAGLLAAESQMQEVDDLRAQLALRRQQLSALSTELQTALQPNAY